LWGGGWCAGGGGGGVDALFGRKMANTARGELAFVGRGGLTVEEY
jgi:hypothetical protein